jgi:ABC-type multidrug transport system fused ATPase/permease subunit
VLGSTVYLNHTYQCFKLLSPKAKLSYLAIVIVQSIISLLDLIGLALIMKIVLGFQAPGDVGDSPLQKTLPLFGNFFPEASANSLLILIVVIFVGKSLVALLLHTATVKLMASETLKLISRLNSSIFENRTNLYKNFSNQDISYAIYNATEIVFRDTLVPISIILADATLIVLILANLFVNAQILFLPTTLYFIGMFLLLRTIEYRSTRLAYKNQWEQEILGRRLIQETIASLRELYVSGKLNWMTSRVFSARESGIKTGSVITIGQLRPKYFYEMALFGGIGIISLVLSISGNSKLISTYLALFIISSSRMIPSLLRIQYYLGIFQKSKEQTSKIFEILNAFTFQAHASKTIPIQIENPNNLHAINKSITIENITFSYEPGKLAPVIHNLSLEVKQGEMIAIVGPSGAGKSTLVDLILGYQIPNSGNVYISQLPPRQSFQKTPGRVAYVPQKVTIYEGSLLSNIVVGDLIGADSNLRPRVESLLQLVGLGDFLKVLEHGLDTKLSELGTSLSGGQIQRIGIARALFTDPEIMVFDESTSSLDSASEDSIMQFLLSFKNQKTMIFIAHRLSTIRSADRICYLGNGRIEAEGNFEVLQELIPDFKKQVSYLNVNSNSRQPIESPNESI